jgi:hypothetical protein
MFTTCLCTLKAEVFQFAHLTHKANISCACWGNLKQLKPRDIVMPVNPKYTAQEWQKVYAAQKPSPEYYSDFKKGAEPQPGKDLPYTFE